MSNAGVVGLRRSPLLAVRPLVLAAIVGGAALLIRPLQDRIDARLRAPGGRSVDVLWFASPAVVKRLALGYESLLADVYWMRTIQYYGRRDEAARRAVRYGNLMPLLDITTTLDPRLVGAYRFGASFLAEPDPVGAGRPDEAIKLLDKGIMQHPMEWQLYFDKGFVYYWFLRDYKSAGEVFLVASRIPDAPKWFEGVAAMMLSRGGALETARALWERQYKESAREDVRQNARNHLSSLQVDQERWTLEFFVEKYRKRFGRRPARLSEMVRPGFLSRVPNDPSGTPYQYYPDRGEVLLSPSSKVHYLNLPDDYRQAVMDELAKMFPDEPVTSSPPK